MVFELRSIWSLGPDVAQNEKMTVLARTRSKFAQSSKGTGSAIVRIFENNEILEIQLYSSKYTHPSTVVSLLGVYGFICFYLTCHFTIYNSRTFLQSFASNVLIYNVYAFLLIPTCVLCPDHRKVSQNIDSRVHSNSVLQFSSIFVPVVRNNTTFYTKNVDLNMRTFLCRILFIPPLLVSLT